MRATVPLVAPVAVHEHPTFAHGSQLRIEDDVNDIRSTGPVRPIVAAAPSPRLRQMVAEAVFRRKRIVIVTLLSVTGLVLALTLLMHRKYASSAKLVVQNVRTAAQLSTSNVDHLVSQGDVSPEEINTEVDLLQSEDVARKALGDSSPDGLGTRQGDRAVRDLEHRLTVDAVHQTDVIDLKVLASSPAEANADLRRVINAYFEERAGTARNSGAAGFFEEQLKEKSLQLDQDQAALTGFEEQHGIADLDDQKKLQITRISTVQDQLAAVEASLAALKGKNSAEQRELATTPARSRTQERRITNQYSQERLNTSLVELQNRRTELLKRYVPSDRQVVEIEEKMATTRQAISDAAAHPADETATDINPVWQQLSVTLAASGGEISGLDAQENALRAQVAAARDRLNELEEGTTAYGELRRKVQQSQADYALYAQRRDEARISEALDREKLFNVAVLQTPLASPDAVRPKPLLYIPVGCVFALLLGISFAVYADISGGQVHSPAQLEALTGMRTLATFADEDLGRHFQESNRLQYRRVLLAVRQATPALQSQQQAIREPERTVAGGFGAGWPDEDDLALEPRGACVGFTSALRGEGVSFLAGNLACEAARQASSRVAVLHMPTLLRSFETGGEISLATTYREEQQHWVLASPEECEAPGGRHRAGALGQLSHQLRPLLERARREFDLIVLDCPSLQDSTLAVELSSCVDGYVGVVRANASRNQNIEDLIAQVEGSSALTFGYILNRRHYPIPRWLYRIL